MPEKHLQHRGLNLPQTLEDICNPQSTALLVYDMQVGIVNQIDDSDQIKAQVLLVLQTARQANLRIFFCRHLSLPIDLMGVSQMRMAMTWQKVDSSDQVKPWFLRDSPAFELIPDVSVLPNEAIFDKITMSAFEGTPLNIALRDCGITSLLIIGAATEVGIEPTVRHAVDLGYIPIIVTDACGTGNKQAAQRSLDSLAYSGDAVLTDVETVCNLFRSQV